MCTCLWVCFETHLQCSCSESYFQYPDAYSDYSRTGEMLGHTSNSHQWRSAWAYFVLPMRLVRCCWPNSRQHRYLLHLQPERNLRGLPQLQFFWERSFDAFLSEKDWYLTGLIPDSLERISEKRYRLYARRGGWVNLFLKITRKI